MINGCNLILEHKNKWKDISRASIEQAHKWLNQWLINGIPLELYSIAGVSNEKEKKEKEILS